MALVLVAYVVVRTHWDVGPYFEVREHRGTVGGTTARLASDIAVGLLLFALFHLSRLLGHIRDGDLFSASVIRSLRRFAQWLFAASLLSIAGPTLAQLVDLSGGAHGRLALMADIRDLMFLIASLVLLLVSRVLETAASIDAELREIV